MPPRKTAAAKKTTTKRPVRKKTPPKPPEPSNSMTMVRVGNNDYPMHTVVNCRTCQSPHRRYIESEILNARTYARISRSVSEMSVGDLPHPTPENLSAHVTRGHMPTPATVRRRIVDRRAQALGSKIMNEEDSLVDFVIVNDTILQQGYERLMSGDLKVSVSDMLTAIANQHKIEQTSKDGYDAEAYQQTLIQYLEVAMQFIPVEQRQAYGAALNKDPILRAIAAKQAGVDTESETVPGSVVESREE